MQPLAAATAITGVGLEGDRKARPGSKRHVLLMDQETIAEFGLRPGDLDENITTRGLALSNLRRGQRIRVGDVLLEATIERPSCHKFDELKPGLGDELAGRRGMMAVVVDGGEIRVGDVIEVFEPAPEAG
jgi:MOSC domain-containing protein YiiM